MAYGKNNKRKKYQRATKKKYPKAIICRAPQICPDVMCVQLKYSGRLTSQGTGILDILDYQFRGNSCFDPDAVTGGSQPLGFDEWSAFYRRYRVKAAKLEARFVNQASVAAICYITANNSSANILSKALITNTQYVKSTEIGVGDDTEKLSMYLSTAQVRGGPVDIVDYEQDLSALISANPAQQWYFHVGAYGWGSSSSNFKVEVDYIITYYVEFYDREVLTPSA